MQPWLLWPAVLLVLAAQCPAWTAPLWQDRHSQLSGMQAGISPLSLNLLPCLASHLLGLTPLCCSHACLHFCFAPLANITAVLCDAVHEATAFVVCLCTIKCVIQEVATLHQLDMLLHDANAALPVAVLQLPVLSLQEKQHYTDC